MALAIDKDDICDAECLGCSNSGAKLCRRWTWLIGGADSIAVRQPLMDGHYCPTCGHAIALKSFKFCPYCGQAIAR